MAKLPERGPSLPIGVDLPRLLSLNPDDLAPLPAAGWSCGVPFLVVAVNSREALARARIDPVRWSSHLERWWTGEVFVVFRPTREGALIHARMFAPAMGIGEDPATGSAVAALAGWLGQLQHPLDGTRHWTVLQGEDMGRPSRIELDVDFADGEPRGVRVGGRCVRVADAEMRVPSVQAQSQA